MSQHLATLNSSSRGFSLVEALVAFTILTVGLIPAFVQASAAVRLSNSVRNSMIASGLAQEGIEVVYAMRNANWYAGDAFDAGLDGCTAGCRVQHDSVVLLPLAGNPPLKRDITTTLMQYNTGTATPFRRVITISAVTAYELYVTSTVSWTEASGDRSIEVEAYLFDWAQ